MPNPLAFPLLDTWGSTGPETIETLPSIILSREPLRPPSPLGRAVPGPPRPENSPNGQFPQTIFLFIPLFNNITSNSLDQTIATTDKLDKSWHAKSYGYFYQNQIINAIANISPSVVGISVIKTNNEQRFRMITKLKSLLNNNLKDKIITVLGLSFKPETNDIRDAASTIICNKQQCCIFSQIVLFKTSKKVVFYNLCSQKQIS